MPRALIVRPGYALAALALLLVEVAIAWWVRDRVIRPIGGDVLAVVLICCGLRAVTSLRVAPATLLAVAAAFAVETGQALGLVERLGLSGNRVARTMLGTSFAVTDLFAYLLGGALIVAVERVRGSR